MAHGERQFVARLTAAGPLPLFTGFPIKPGGALSMSRKSQKNRFMSIGVGKKDFLGAWEQFSLY
ncbi:hypothetical protein Defa_13440 [Desulfovibrio sp. TH_2024_36128]|uniref:Uncharacterized protein n=1 Tax=Desulfovibrio falkowii TaxID=3136602 RepID=A0ABQ0E873_9BACT